MASAIDYKKPAELVWDDVTRLTSGVGYSRGRPSFKGTLAETVRHFAALPQSCRPYARITTTRQKGLDNKTVFSAVDIEAIRRRKDFPKK